MWKRVTENVFSNRFQIYLAVEELSSNDIYYSSVKFSQAASCVNLRILTRPSAQENFVEFCCHKSFETYIYYSCFKNPGQQCGYIYIAQFIKQLTE